MLLPLDVEAYSPFPHTYTYNGYLVRWSGWITAPAQCVTYGAWIAITTPNNVDRWMRVMTTMGILQLAHEMEPIDLHREAGWPSSPFHSNEDFMHAKHRAAWHLYTYLTEVPMYGA